MQPALGVILSLSVGPVPLQGSLKLSNSCYFALCVGLAERTQGSHCEPETLSQLIRAALISGYSLLNFRFGFSHGQGEPTPISGAGRPSDGAHNWTITISRRRSAGHSYHCRFKRKQSVAQSDCASHASSLILNLTGQRSEWHRLLIDEATSPRCAWQAILPEGALPSLSTTKTTGVA